MISLNRDMLLERPRAIARKIRAQHPEAVKARPFGSPARGDQAGTSAIDIPVVLDPTECIPVHTRAELGRHSPVLRRIWQESIPRYAR